MVRLSVLVADPAWQFSDALPGKRGASSQYQCMSVDRIKALPIPVMGENAALFLWLVESMQQEALDVVKAWGFSAKTSGIWDKLTKHGKPWFGMGHSMRASHERFIFATRGSAPVASKRERSRFDAKVPCNAAGEYIHSAKPNEFFDLVTRLYPFSFETRHYEMFARTRRPGWIQFGNQLGEIEI